MEIYSFYEAISQSIFLIRKNINWQLLVVSLCIGVGIWIGLFLLQAFGLYKMAKNRGMKKKWLAFMPFANIYYAGKLAGETSVFGQRVKRAGLYAMIGQILSVLFCTLTIFAQLYLYFVEGVPTYSETETSYSYYWNDLTGTSWKMYRFYDLSQYIVPIFVLVYRIFMLILLNGLYKKYTPKNYFPLLFLSFVVPESRFIVIFVLRNKKAVDFEAYMRARREAYMRRYQQQNPYNPYNNPYGNPYGQNPYSQGQNQTQTPPPKREEPFEEFSSKTGKDGQNKTPPDPNDPDQFFN
jgi:hypothetical protein